MNSFLYMEGYKVFMTVDELNLIKGCQMEEKVSNLHMPSQKHFPCFSSPHPIIL